MAQTTCEAYRGYLIRWSAFTIVRDAAAYWIERDNQFIGWADTVPDAKRIIDGLI